MQFYYIVLLIYFIIIALIITKIFLNEQAVSWPMVELSLLLQATQNFGTF